MNEDPVMVEFCRTLRDYDILDDYYSRTKLFEAIDRVIERRIAAKSTGNDEERL